MNYNKDIPQNPKLIEPGVAYFLKQNLKQCKKQKYVYFPAVLRVKLFCLSYITFRLELQE